ncbi:hypothetical protein NL676_012891 [Syzygium grande]|nr:hypothetical protein NL676_012891 [Syzygium grande]
MDLQRFRAALEEARDTVGLTFDTVRGDWLKLLKDASDAVVRTVLEVDQEGSCVCSVSSDLRALLPAKTELKAVAQEPRKIPRSVSVCSPFRREQSKDRRLLEEAQGLCSPFHREQRPSRERRSWPWAGLYATSLAHSRKLAANAKTVSGTHPATLVPLPIRA